ncbi:MAG TPA: alpha/beta hydrolase [Cyclobacteriaceae bacterium]|nr:alpha/beta hydrolase [Cyclobacteriaceae bacterium]
MKILSLLWLCLCFGLYGWAAPIDVRQSVMINGIHQWIHIKGSDSTMPVLLYLHGGPGNSAMGYADKFTRELQHHFVVVMWDQRESGRTATLNATQVSLTVDLVMKDAYAMINYLRERFAQHRIYLMGHSWGGFLALYVAANHPETLQGCFALAPMVHQQRSEQEMLQMMLSEAGDRNDTEAMKELASVHIPFENGEQLYFHRKWLSRKMGTPSSGKSFVLKWSVKWLALFNEGSAINLFEAAPEIRCPVYFFVGSRDYQTSSKLTEAYFRVVKAEKKDLFWFTNSAHSLNLTEPTKLQDLVISLKDKP